MSYFLGYLGKDNFGVSTWEIYTGHTMLNGRPVGGTRHVVTGDLHSALTAGNALWELS